MRSSQDDEDMSPVNCDPDRQLCFGSNLLRECKIAGSSWWWHTNLLLADWPIYLFIAWWKSNLCTFKINERQRCISWNLKMKFAKKVSSEYRSNSVLSPWCLLTLASWSNLPNNSLRSLTRSWKKLNVMQCSVSFNNWQRLKYHNIMQLNNNNNSLALSDDKQQILGECWVTSSL